MLEEMRQARNARRIVHRADLEPQHLGDDRRAVIGDHQHLHAVLQRELEGLRRCRPGRRSATAASAKRAQLMVLAGIGESRLSSTSQVRASQHRCIPHAELVEADGAIRQNGHQLLPSPCRTGRRRLSWSWRCRRAGRLAEAFCDCRRLASESASTLCRAPACPARTEPVGEAVVGRLHRAAVGGDFLADRGIGVLRAGIGEQQLLALADSCPDSLPRPWRDRCRTAPPAPRWSAAIWLGGGAPARGGRRLKSGGMISGALVTTANSSGDCLPQARGVAERLAAHQTAPRRRAQDRKPNRCTRMHGTPCDSSPQALLGVRACSSASYRSAMTPKVMATSATLKTYQS